MMLKSILSFNFEHQMFKVRFTSLDAIAFSKTKMMHFWV